MPKNLFITGNPGCGKTTLIKEIYSLYPDKIGGFYTEEIRDESGRAGFMLKTFDGKSGIFAHKKMVFPHKFNKYGVDISCLENIGIPAIDPSSVSKEIIVIDEVGSMEVLSELFRRKLYECLTSPIRVIATIRLKAQPFTDEIKKLSNGEMLVLTRQNYREIKSKVIRWIDSLS